jgi:hypothetical protein
MDFLNHMEGGYGFLSGIRPVSFTETVRGCVSLKKYKSQDKAVEVTVNKKEENSKDFCLDFVQELSHNPPNGVDVVHP